MLLIIALTFKNEFPVWIAREYFEDESTLNNEIEEENIDDNEDDSISVSSKLEDYMTTCLNFVPFTEIENYSLERQQEYLNAVATPDLVYSQDTAFFTQFVGLMDS